MAAKFLSERDAFGAGDGSGVAGVSQVTSTVLLLYGCCGVFVECLAAVEDGFVAREVLLRGGATRENFGLRGVLCSGAGYGVTHATSIAYYV